MDTSFLDQLAVSQATIPTVVSRIAAFFLCMQAILIVVQKKNDPYKDIWEDLSGVLLAGLIVYMFPEIIKFMELLVNSMCSVADDSQTTSGVFDALSQSMFPDEEAVDAGEAAPMSFNMLISILIAMAKTSGANMASFGLATMILKPLADFVNTLCFPTYWIIRAVSLKVVYMVAPLSLVLGAIQPFRGLWKHWLMIYVALLVAGPALVVANNFCEECFNIYIATTGSPILGFIIVALARYKAFQAVLDLCYRLFSV